MTAIVRSALYHLCFYVMTTAMLLATMPVFFFVSRENAMKVPRAWARTTLWLLRAVAGTRVELRGTDHLVGGPSIVASKHQSMFETIALIPFLRDPTIIMKRELLKIPVFGAYTVRTGMIHVDRGGSTGALRALVERAREELARGREIIVFPEGTRRPPGAEPAYQPGIGLIYKQLGVPVVPVAHNSGLYWPKRGFFRYPGTIVMEFLPPIAPGLSARVFLETLEERIETASDRLLLEAARATPPPPLPPEAAARVADAGQR